MVTATPLKTPKTIGQFAYSFTIQLDGENAKAREVAVRPGKTGNQAVSNRTGADEDDRDRRGRTFRRQCQRGTAGGRNHVDANAGSLSSRPAAHGIRS